MASPSPLPPSPLPTSPLQTTAMAWGSRSAAAATAARLRRQPTNVRAAPAASAKAGVPLLVDCTTVQPRTSRAANSLGELPNSKSGGRRPPSSPHRWLPGSAAARRRATVCETQG